MFCKRKLFIALLIALLIPITLFAQAGEVDPRPITMEEYELAKTFDIEDLDTETYVKFDNRYILDRYEMKPPIYITGDDGLRKRVDLYKLVAREGLQELGIMIFYTAETGTKYKALVPNFTASGEVWEAYFEDIHSIDKIEKNYILKLSYVLSREYSYQIYKGLNAGEVMDEHATYGSDICFPGDQLVTLADGTLKQLKEIKIGDKVRTLDPSTQTDAIVTVNKLVTHIPQNYAITVLTLLDAEEKEEEGAASVRLSIKELKATPNHPMLTSSGAKPIGEIKPGEEILSWNESAGRYESFIVFDTSEITEGRQPVYSIEADAGSTLIMNGVMVRQKNR